jgi:hypothetical protein
MHMQIDKSGCDDHSFGVKNTIGHALALAVTLGFNRGYRPAIVDVQISDSIEIGGGIDDAPAFDHPHGRAVHGTPHVVSASSLSGACPPHNR